MKKTKAVRDNEQAYKGAKPKQFGNLHERMKYLMTLISDFDKCKTIPNEVMHAIYDLKTEVEGCKPITPPVGRMDA